MYGTPFATTEIQPGKIKTNKQNNVGLKSEENSLICVPNVQLTKFKSNSLLAKVIFLQILVL